MYTCIQNALISNCLYYKGDAVLVRIPISKKSVKGKKRKTSLQSRCEGCIIDADHNLHKYNIEFNDPVTSENKNAWFKVDDIASLTKEEENKRQQMAKERIPQKRKRQAGSESNTEVDQVRGTLQKAIRNESILDASIHQVNLWTVCYTLNYSNVQCFTDCLHYTLELCSLIALQNFWWTMFIVNVK